MRGEHPWSNPASRGVKGSSPHARGTHVRGGVSYRCAGIIPACAGNTSTPSRGPRGRGDHPRMRGEHEKLMCAFHDEMGSSPHARGTQ